MEVAQPNGDSSGAKRSTRRRFQTEYNHKIEFSLNLVEIVASQVQSADKSEKSPSPLTPQYYTSFISFKQRPQKYFLIGTHDGDILYN